MIRQSSVLITKYNAMLVHVQKLLLLQFSYHSDGEEGIDLAASSAAAAARDFINLFASAFLSADCMLIGLTFLVWFFFAEVQLAVPSSLLLLLLL